MRRQRLVISFLWALCLMMNQAYATDENKFSISGYIRSAGTGEVLLFANVLIVELNTGVTTNQYGYYSINIPAGNYTLQCSYLGYETITRKIFHKKNVISDIELHPKSTLLNSVEITGKSAGSAVRSMEMSVIKLDINQLKAVPALFGEKDILKGIQLLPGVSPSSEGSSNYFVRGGEADQNHILLDEAPVYNASHLMGFFSVFNSDAVKDVKLYKGGIPAPYGGRVSSVLDIRMRDGNFKEWGVTGGIGLISSRLSLEGPLVKDKSSILLSGRRTYADVMYKAVSNDADSLTFYFYDFNLKANYILGAKDRLYISGYIGNDIFGRKEVAYNSGNATLTLRWNHIFSPGLFSNTSVVFSDYNYGFKVMMSGMDFDLTSGIMDYSAKQDFTYFPNTNNTIRFGWSTAYHQFKPGTLTSDEDRELGGLLGEIPAQQALENGVYLSNEQKLSSVLCINYGTRFSLFNNVGPATVKTWLARGILLDSTFYSDGEFYNTYFGFEPRLTGTWLLSNAQSIKASYNRMFQYLHILSNSLSGSPTDLWTPSTPLIRPTIANQVATGYFKNFDNRGWDFSVEAYYKTLRNLVDFQNGANTYFNPDIESELVFGRGRAYGVEFSAVRSAGKLTGWVSYTLSKSEKQFDKINYGNWFSSRQDRTHNVSIVGTFKLTERFSLSGNWIFYTGDAVTFPSGKYVIDGILVNLYTERNGSRMPDYHRLDLGLTYQFKPRKKWSSDINISFYNVYNRKNAYTISFVDSEENPGTTEAVRLSLFGLVPSISWNFKF
jgi:hypothetical protein